MRKTVALSTLLASFVLCSTAFAQSAPTCKLTLPYSINGSKPFTITTTYAPRAVQGFSSLAGCLNRDDMDNAMNILSEMARKKACDGADRATVWGSRSPMKVSYGYGTTASDRAEFDIASPGDIGCDEY